MAKVSLQQFCLKNRKEKLIEQWSLPENKGFDPCQTGYASHKKIWWVCEKGHRWQAVVSDRAGKESGCPFCAGKKAWPGFNDLAGARPDLASQWHPEKNGELTAEKVTCGSGRKVWWKCGFGHEWKAPVENRAQKGQGCPFCAGRKAWPGENDLATLEPELMKEWHPDLNGGIDPSVLRPGSRIRVWWRCPEGHEWEAYLFNRTIYRSGCPFCAGNLPEGKAAGWKAAAAEKRKKSREKAEIRHMIQQRDNRFCP